jgi:hypothetical protein
MKESYYAVNKFSWSVHSDIMKCLDKLQPLNFNPRHRNSYLLLQLQETNSEVYAREKELPVGVIFQVLHDGLGRFTREKIPKGRLSDMFFYYNGKTLSVDMSITHLEGKIKDLWDHYC